jgi:chromosome segregation ATPase
MPLKAQNECHEQRGRSVPQIGVKTDWDAQHTERKKRWKDRRIQKGERKRRKRRDAAAEKLKKWRAQMEARKQIQKDGRNAERRLQNMYNNWRALNDALANYRESLEDAKRAVDTWRTRYQGRIGYEEELERAIKERDAWQTYYDWKTLPPPRPAPPAPEPETDDELTEDED